MRLLIKNDTDKSLIEKELEERLEVGKNLSIHSVDHTEVSKLHVQELESWYDSYIDFIDHAFIHAPQIEMQYYKPELPGIKRTTEIFGGYSVSLDDLAVVKEEAAECIKQATRILKTLKYADILKDGITRPNSTSPIGFGRK